MNRKIFFDKHAQRWDTLISKENMEKIEKYIIPALELKEGGKVIDVGSGTGVLLPFLKDIVGAKGVVVALDYSQKMLDKAKEKYGDVFCYICKNAEHTLLANNYFDAVVCFSVFPHFSNKLRALKEMHRIMKPGGRLIIAHADLRETINEYHKKVGAPVLNDHMPDNDAIEKLITKTGFKNLEIREQMDCYIATMNK